MDGKTFHTPLRRIVPTLTVCAVLSGALAGAPASAADAEPTVLASSGPTARAANGTYLATAISYEGDRPVYTRVEGSTESAALTAAKKVAGARSVTLTGEAYALDEGMSLEVGPLNTDPGRPNQYSLDRINLAGVSPAADLGTQLVAVVDSGVRGSHQDFRPGQVLCGLSIDYTGTVPNGCTDDNGHGTHVAGTIGAVTGNGLGIAGVASGVRILPLKVLRSDGLGSTDHIAAAIVAAVDRGATVINLSVGGPANPAYESALQYAYLYDVVVIAATGNNAQEGNGRLYPAGYDERVHGVGATDSNDAWATFSTFGSQVDIAAPGVNILSLSHNGDNLYRYSSGTSMAAPHVAGVAALIRARNPGTHRNFVEYYMVLRATDRGTAGRDNYYGWGRINAGAAYLESPAGTFGQMYRTLSVAGSSFKVYPGATDHTDEHTFTSPAVNIESTKSRRGYWVVSEKGEVFGKGDALHYGDLRNIRLNAPIIDIAATPSGNGYWLLARDGGVFSYGDAAFYGSTGNIRLNQPAVGMTPTADGRGYWFVASDGGIFAFGSAAFHGSMGNVRLNKQVVGMTVSTTGNGYRMVGSDGGIFSFGDARFYGSTGSSGALWPVVAMLPTPSGNGYWMLENRGHVHAFGDAEHKFDTHQPVVVGIAASRAY